jgi:hypothetical protein
MGQGRTILIAQNSDIGRLAPLSPLIANSFENAKQLRL